MAKLIAVCGATVKCVLFPHCAPNTESDVIPAVRSPDSSCNTRTSTAPVFSPGIPSLPPAKSSPSLGAEVVRADLTIRSDVHAAHRDCLGVFGMTNFCDSVRTIFDCGPESATHRNRFPWQKITNARRPEPSRRHAGERRAMLRVEHAPELALYRRLCAQDPRAPSLPVCVVTHVS